MDQSSSEGSGAPFRMTLPVICLLRESSDILKSQAHFLRTQSSALIKYWQVFGPCLGSA